MNWKILGIACYIFVVGCSVSGQQDAFAQCLFEEEATMYGADWCPHCKEQKKIFGNSFQYVDYVECTRNRDACIAADIKGYPTWIIKGEVYSGIQQLDRLSSLTGCPLQ